MVRVRVRVTVMVNLDLKHRTNKDLVLAFDRVFIFAILSFAFDDLCHCLRLCLCLCHSASLPSTVGAFVVPASCLSHTLCFCLRQSASLSLTLSFSLPLSIMNMRTQGRTFRPSTSPIHFEDSVTTSKPV
jgi:hypothetical protein